MGEVEAREDNNRNRGGGGRGKRKSSGNYICFDK